MDEVFKLNKCLAGYYYAHSRTSIDDHVVFS